MNEKTKEFEESRSRFFIAMSANNQLPIHHLFSYLMSQPQIPGLQRGHSHNWASLSRLLQLNGTVNKSGNANVNHFYPTKPLYRENGNWCYGHLSGSNFFDTRNLSVKMWKCENVKVWNLSVKVCSCVITIKIQMVTSVNRQHQLQILLTSAKTILFFHICCLFLNWQKI